MRQWWKNLLLQASASGTVTVFSAYGNGSSLTEGMGHRGHADLARCGGTYFDLRASFDLSDDERAAAQQRLAGLGERYTTIERSRRCWGRAAPSHW